MSGYGANFQFRLAAQVPLLALARAERGRLSPAARAEVPNRRTVASARKVCSTFRTVRASMLRSPDPPAQTGENPILQRFRAESWVELGRSRITLLDTFDGLELPPSRWLRRVAARLAQATIPIKLR